jgi:hypothetical protein
LTEKKFLENICNTKGRVVAKLIAHLAFDPGDSAGIFA